MKCLVAITVLLQLSSAWALSDPGDPVHLFPRIWRMSNAVQVDVWNTSEVDVDCSGNIIIFTRSGRTQTEYYWETIYRGMSRNRYYHLRDFRDQVTSVHDYIRCRER